MKWRRFRVVSDREGTLWFRLNQNRWHWSEDGPVFSSSELEEMFGPLTPRLDNKGRVVVLVVGDLTAAHRGERVCLMHPDLGELRGELSSIRVTRRGIFLFVSGHEVQCTLETPCRVLKAKGEQG